MSEPFFGHFSGKVAGKHRFKRSDRVTRGSVNSGLYNYISSIYIYIILYILYNHIHILDPIMRLNWTSSFTKSTKSSSWTASRPGLK